MKILYVVTQGDFGGAQKYVFDLACAAKDRGEQVSVAIGRSQDRTLVRKLKEIGIEVIELKHLVREIVPLKEIAAVFELIRVYNNVRPDIIHLNSSKAGIVGSCAKSLSGLRKSRLVFTVHGWYFNEPMGQLKKLFFVWLEKMQAGAKDIFICVSDLDHRSGLENKVCRPDKIVTIHNGIDLDSSAYLPAEEASVKLLGRPKAPDEKLIGTIANFYSTKGLQYLIAAADILINKEKMPYTFVVVGDGMLRPELENQISSLGLRDKFLLPGRIDNAKLLAKAFDCCVLSSVKEGLPYTILELMAVGIPQVATKVGGIPEAIDAGKNGILVELKNPGALAEAISNLLAYPDEATKMAERGRQIVAEKFNKERQIEETWKVYDNLLRN